MNEIQVIIDQQPGEIRFNYEDIERMLQERLKIYENAIITEDGKTVAKKEVAALRKLKKEMDDRRKMVKKEWNVPLVEFEDKVRTLLSMVDVPINQIESQVKAFEEEQKKQKQEKVKALYEELIGDIREYLPFAKVYVPSWSNITTSMKKVREELLAKIDAVQKDLFTIQSMQSDAVSKALELYKNSLNVTEAVQYINQFEQQKQEILEKERKRAAEEEERRRQAELERVRMEERKRVEEEERIRKEAEEKARKEAEEKLQTEENPFVVPESDEIEEGFHIDEEELPFEQPSTKTVFYKVIATPGELEQVEMAFNSIGIVFSRRDASLKQ